MDLPSVYDDYSVSFDLEEIIGKGALISFKKENHWRSLDVEDGILYIELMEEDAYKGIGEEVESLKEKILSGKQDIIESNQGFGRTAS